MKHLFLFVLFFIASFVSAQNAEGGGGIVHISDGADPNDISNLHSANLFSGETKMAYDSYNKIIWCFNEANAPCCKWEICGSDETVTTLVDNGDDTYTYTAENGIVTTIVAGQTLTSLVDNGDNTFTYTSEDATVTIINNRKSAIRREVADYVIDYLTDYTILADIGTDTVTLPSGADIGQVFVIKDIAEPFSLIVNTATSELIDGAASYNFTSENEAVQFQFDGIDFFIIN